MLERLGRGEEALGIYAYSVHRYRDNPTELGKARTYFVNLLQTKSKSLSDAHEFVGSRYLVISSSF
jgi:hypothetical protein